MDSAPDGFVGEPGPGRVVLDLGRSPLVVLGQDDSYDEHNTIARILELSDEDALVAALWHLTHDRLLLRVLRRRIPLDVAEDVLQDVFALLIEQLPRVRGPKIVGWLCTMADYECARQTSKLERARANRASAVRNLPRAGADPLGAEPEAKLDTKRALNETWELVLNLSPIDAYIMQATVLDGAPAAEIIQVIGRRYDVSLTLGALYERRRKLRRALANRLVHRRRGGVHGGEHD